MIAGHGLPVLPIRACLRAARMASGLKSTRLETGAPRPSLSREQLAGRSRHDAFSRDATGHSGTNGYGGRQPSIHSSPRRREGGSAQSFCWWRWRAVGGGLAWQHDHTVVAQAAPPPPPVTVSLPLAGNGGAHHGVPRAVLRRRFGDTARPGRRHADGDRFPRRADRPPGRPAFHHRPAALSRSPCGRRSPSSRRRRPSTNSRSPSCGAQGSSSRPISAPPRTWTSAPPTRTARRPPSRPPRRRSRTPSSTSSFPKSARRSPGASARIWCPSATW